MPIKKVEMLCRVAQRRKESVDMFKRAAMIFGLGLGLLLMVETAPAQAQSAVCERLAPLMKQRQALMQRINGMGRKNVNPATACSLFSSLASNGAQTIAFANENKDWCQIPDDFVNGLTSSQRQISDVRGKACQAAKQRVAQERLGRQIQSQRAQQAPGTEAFGGADGFSSTPWRVPQGAL